MSKMTGEIPSSGYLFYDQNSLGTSSPKFQEAF